MAEDAETSGGLKRRNARSRRSSCIGKMRRCFRSFCQSLRRQQLVEEHARLDTLYRMASGNVSGARMDLETYVQRYYLEKILQSANRRFYEMSAGQFELRMYELEKAGEGKNRGLDLMVYSNVTGKEREVRTLSGGELRQPVAALWDGGPDW